MIEKIRVLHVDDCPLDRDLVRDALVIESDSFELTAASTRQEFSDLLLLGEFDLVLSDFNILGFEGLQVIEEVGRCWPGVPVVIVTGTGSEEIAVQALKKGAYDYVIKTPQQIRHLPFTIQAVMERQRLKLEQQRQQVELEAANDKLHRLAHHMSQVREDEKKHLARELHDHLGQELTIIKLGVNEIESYLRSKEDDCCEKASSVVKMIDQAIDMVRQTSIDLRPASLDFFGLETVIQDEAKKAERASGLVVQVDCAFSAEDLTEQLTVDLYRLIQESLTNVIRHAQATEVSLTLKQTDGMIYLVIADNGVGISEEDVLHLGSPGLLGMRERVHAHKGTFSIGPGQQGTRVAVGIPLAGSAGAVP